MGKTGRLGLVGCVDLAKTMDGTLQVFGTTLARLPNAPDREGPSLRGGLRLPLHARPYAERWHTAQDVYETHPGTPKKIRHA